MRRQWLAICLTVPLSASKDFTRDIQPILEKRCVGCHSATATMGSLNLETWEGLLKGGNNGPILVPGKSKESTLYLSVVGKAPDIGRMPFSNEVMPEAETEAIREWIDEGAPAAATKPQQIYSLAWRPDGKGIALGAYQIVRLMDATGQTETAQLSGHADAVRAVAWSKDGSFLAAAGGSPGRKGEVKIWKADGTLQATISGHADCIYGLAISPDGKTIATASYDKLIKLWDATTGQEVRTLKDHIDAIYALAFTPDGKRLVSGAADRSIKVWNPESGERLFTMSEPTDGVNTLAISPDGKRIAAAGQDKTIRVWVLEEKGATLESSMIAHEDAILKIVWSKDGKTLLSSSADRSLKLFRATDLTELKMIGSQPDWAYAVEYSPDGSRVALGRMNGSLTITEIKP
jgi:WD40 repeat protein